MITWPVEFFYWPPWAIRGGAIYRESLSRSGIKVIEQPTTEQLTVDEVALHLRLDAYGSPPTYPEQTWIEAAIAAARETIEGLSGLALAPQTLELGMNAWPIDCFNQAGISLRTGPLLGVTSIIYNDGTADTTLDEAMYSVDGYSVPGVVYPAYNQSWPTAVMTPNSIKIRFRAGYNTSGESPQDAPLPKALRAAMLLLIGHLYANREATSTAANIEQIPLGINALIERYRIRSSLA